MIAFLASVGSFVPGLFGKQISYGLAKVLGGITLAALVLGLLALGKCAYDKSVINDYQAQQEVKAAGAREQAADERLSDQTNNAKSEEELHDVINAAPPSGTLSPASRALACERLRRAGRVPTACRPASGDGNQTSSP